MTYFLRSGVLSGLPELLEEFDVDVAALLEPLGLSIELLNNEDSLLEMDTVGELLALGARHCDCPHFGLLLGSRQSMEFLGVLGLIMQSAPDVATAFEECFRYHDLHAQGVDWSIQIEGDYAFVKLNYEEGIQSSYQGIGLALAQGNNLWRLITDNKWRPQEVCFHYDKPEEVWFYRQLFGSNVRFNADFDGMVFRADYLRSPVQTKNDYLHDTLNRFVEELSRDAAPDFVAQVRRIVRQMLSTGNCSIEAVATLFNCDKRTLQRRLKREGVTYQDLLNEERFNVACKHLKSSSTPLTTIAELVGFADVSTFSRAFKQHVGCSPSVWRQNAT